jgi:4-amino-4-deoxy-L-arabinose transferase-like glycosyltransferase
VDLPDSSGVAGAPRWPRWLTPAFFALALCATVPTAGDIGLTWDEPAYRYSQVMSAQWWGKLAQARSADDLKACLDPDALLYYWPYGRFGINFHPPLAGQLNLATYGIFGGFMKDIPARRMATVLEYALTLAILFSFLGRRYGVGVGLAAAGSLLVMPRVYGDGHVGATDMPGLLLWAATAVAFWKGLNEPNSGRWRAAVGILVGLGFVEKMAAVMILLPIFLWLGGRWLARLATLRSGWREWADWLATTAVLSAPLLVAGWEVLRLAKLFPPPEKTDLFVHRPESAIPGAILALPALLWVARRALARWRRGHPTWGVERPALEIWCALIALPPLVGWLGNPAWWGETLPRLTHYYMLNTARRGTLPNILILYFGQTYDYSLPWHNGFVLAAITVPATILVASALGLHKLFQVKDRLPWYFLVQMLALPCVRMLDTPAHDGVRLMLPTFFFLAGFAGWGAMGLASAISRLGPRVPIRWSRAACLAALLLPPAWQLARIHPYELSYYNEFIGGPRGAWKSGFELTYWFEAFNRPVLEDLNEKFPPGAKVTFPNKLSEPPTFQELRWLGELRPDVNVESDPSAQLSYKWLLTQDAKASGFSRLLFAMSPWYSSNPSQLGKLRVTSVAGPVDVSRALALWLLVGEAAGPNVVARGNAPRWAAELSPILARFWGDGLTLAPPLRVHEPSFSWAKEDPDDLRGAAKELAAGEETARAARLFEVLGRIRGNDYDPSNPSLAVLLRQRPEAVPEAVEMLIRRPDAVRAVLTRYGYTDPATIGGYLDRDLPPAKP